MKKYIYIISLAFVSTIIYLNKDDNKKKELPPLFKQNDEINTDSLSPLKTKDLINNKETLKQIRSLKYSPIQIIFSNKKYDFFMTQQNKKILSTKEDNNSLFILKDNLAFPQRKPHCVSISPISDPIMFLSEDKGIITLKKYNTEKDFLTNSSFCLFKTSTNKWIIKNIKSKKFINNTSTGSAFSNNKFTTTQLSMASKLYLKFPPNLKLPISFKTFTPNLGYDLYTLNKKKYTFQKAYNEIPKKLYFQPIKIERSQILRQKKYANFLRVKRKNSALSFSKKKSYQSTFMITPSLFYPENKECISVTSYIQPNKYILQNNFQLFMKKLQNTKEFKKKATFCLEKHGIDIYRLRLPQQKDFYIDYHTMENGYLYLIKDNFEDPAKQALSFVDKKSRGGIKHFNIFNPIKNKKVLFYYNKNKKRFTQEPQLHITKNITLQIKSFFNIHRLPTPKCEYLNERQQIFYQNTKITDNEEINFIIDQNDHKYLNQLTCTFALAAKDNLQIMCNTTQETITIKNDCNIRVTINNNTKLYNKNNINLFSLEKINI
jgi:hypothetical protein